MVVLRLRTPYSGVDKRQVVTMRQQVHIGVLDSVHPEWHRDPLHTADVRHAVHSCGHTRLTVRPLR